MKSSSVVLAVLVLCVGIVISIEYVDEIDSAPQKVYVRPVPNGLPTKSSKPIHYLDFPSSHHRLVNLINSHRRSFGLQNLALSPSLTFVAHAHANDQRFRDITYGIDQTVSSCDLYSWTASLGAKGCCSTPSARSACFESKVEELTSYPGVGVELVYATNHTIELKDLDHVVSLWIASQDHRNVILNKGPWSDVVWKSVGAGISGGYATIWFGALLDPVTWSPSKESPSWYPHIMPTVAPSSAWYNPTSAPSSAWYNPTQWQWYTPTPAYYPTSSWYYPTQWEWYTPTPAYYPTSSWYYPTSSWYNPTQSYTPTSSWYYPTQSWYPTSSWYHPTTWFTETPTTSSPSSNNTHISLWHRMRTHLPMFWMIVLSVLVLVLLISNLVMFRVIRKLRQEVRIALFTAQGTSCAIPEKC